MPGPLAGIRVVDVSAILSGPICTMMLADQGAEVTKVEPLQVGDLVRAGGYRRGGLNALFVNANRGKRSLALDLSRPRGREVLLRLLEGADVFVQNWRPGAAERLGLGEEQVRAVSPQIIYCAISGYGQSGPYSKRRVYDPIIQGITGHVAVQKNPDVPIPDLVRTVVSDKSSAWTAAQAITAALFARERGAGGQRIEVPMLDASLAFFWPDGMMAHTMMDECEITGPTLYQLYRLWETADGHLIYFAGSDAENHGLFRALNRPELCEDPRFATMDARSRNNAALGELLMQEIRKWPTQELLERMVAEQVPAGAALSIEEMLEDPQLRHNEAVFEWEHPQAGRFRQARPAARFSKTPQKPGRMPPLHGEHTGELLAELGYDAEAQRALRAEGVIA
ncbi:MAG: CoA transferase [Deltaproteobacteria bacterium]|nr:CoA transferase [Deltaproteobacteria bacterium]MDD9853253.1 CoA transferase [Deltaproteobacteria bacterium]